MSPDVTIPELKGNVQFSFSNVNGKLEFDAKDLHIDNISLPTFSWGWMAVSIAQGVVSAFGGMMFTALVNGIFNQGGGGPSIEDLFKQLLPAFAVLVQQSIDANAMREYTAKANGVLQRYREYVNDPNPMTLSLLIEDSSDVLQLLESMKFQAYSGYMNMAGLRLNILQEEAKVSKYKAGAATNFDQQRSDAVAYHQQSIANIIGDTDPSKTVASAAGKNAVPIPAPQGLVDGDGDAEFAPGVQTWRGGGDVYWHNAQDLIGGKVSGLTWIRNGAWVPKVNALADERFTSVYEDSLQTYPYIDWPARRKDIEAKSTDIGQIAVNRWLAAPGTAKHSLF